VGEKGGRGNPEKETGGGGLSPAWIKKKKEFFYCHRVSRKKEGSAKI